MSKCQLLFAPNSMSCRAAHQKEWDRNLGHTKTNDGKHISNVLIRIVTDIKQTVQCKRVTRGRIKKKWTTTHEDREPVWHFQNVCAPRPTHTPSHQRKCLDHVSDTKWTYYNMPEHNLNWHLRKRTNDSKAHAGEKEIEQKHVTTPKFEHLFDLFARMRLPPEMYRHIHTHTHRVKRIVYKLHYKIAQHFHLENPALTPFTALKLWLLPMLILLLRADLILADHWRSK